MACTKPIYLQICNIRHKELKTVWLSHTVAARKCTPLRGEQQATFNERQRGKIPYTSISGMQGGENMKPESISEKMMFNTVRLETESGMGTGFFCI